MALRFGVVGTAFWARDVHLPGLLATPGAEVMGVWGRTPEPAEAMAAAHGVRAFSSFEEMLDAVDALTMAVPPTVQAGLALQAAKAGKHLLLEKPVTRDRAAAQAIADALAAHRSAGLVFFTRRFIPEFEALIEAERGRGWTGAAIRVHQPTLTTATPYLNSAWRHENEAALWDVGPHALSALIPLLGPVHEVTGQPETDGVQAFTTRHAHGGTAEVSVSLRAPAADASNRYRFVSPDRELLLPETPIQRAAALAQAATALIRMAESGETRHECDLRLGVTTVGVLAAVAQSARAGRPISLA